MFVFCLCFRLPMRVSVTLPSLLPPPPTFLLLTPPPSPSFLTSGPPRHIRATLMAPLTARVFQARRRCVSSSLFSATPFGVWEGVAAQQYQSVLITRTSPSLQRAPAVPVTTGSKVITLQPGEAKWLCSCGLSKVRVFFESRGQCGCATAHDYPVPCSYRTTPSATVLTKALRFPRIRSRTRRTLQRTSTCAACVGGRA